MSKKEEAKSKVVNKIVRISVTDNRIFVGRLLCVDKTKAIFLQDSLEIIDREAPDYLDHEIFIPQILKDQDPTAKKIHKLMGSVVIPGKYVTKIELDNKLSKLYEEKCAELKQDKSE